MAKKNSLKNCKPLVDLIDTATPAALALLSPVECFGFLSAVDRERADHEVRSDIKTVVASLRRDVVAVANHGKGQERSFPREHRPFPASRGSLYKERVSIGNAHLPRV